MNAQLIKEKLPRDERVAYLSRMAASQLKALKANPTITKLENDEKRLFEN